MRWLATGYAGTMRYLHRQARKRKDPRRIVPEAQSVVVVLDNYLRQGSARRIRPPEVRSRSMPGATTTTR